MKISFARRITLILVVVLVLVSFAFHTGSGTLSSLGWDAIAYICPLGAIEAFLASWTFVPRQVIALILCVVAVILLGKVLCAWLCPVPPLRKFFTFKKDDSVEKALEKARESHEVLSAVETQDTTSALLATGVAVVSGETEENGSGPVGEGALGSVDDGALGTAGDIVVPVTCSSETKDLGVCSSGCGGCATQRRKLDSRHLVLGGALLSTVIFGFPVFCVVCPVGLTFASLIALWRLVGFNEPSWALLIFPLFLVFELFVLRKWCVKFCPLGALMSLMSIPNKLFRPHVDTKKCLRSQGIDCLVCVSVCEEELDPHYPKGMHECTKCGLCKEKCPAHAITIPLYVAQSKKEQDLNSTIR